MRHPAKRGSTPPMWQVYSLIFIVLVANHNGGGYYTGAVLLTGCFLWLWLIDGVDAHYARRDARARQPIRLEIRKKHLR